MDAHQIIVALGGKRAVAELTRSKPNAVTQWHRIGIPSKFWHVLVTHAEQSGVRGITFDTLQGTKPTPTQASAA